MNDLLSKMTAGGLSAGLFLLWWPAHLPADGLGWLVLRGLAWTLAFELLLACLLPLERRTGRALARRPAAERVRGRLAGAPAQARAGGAVMLALTAVIVPLIMLANADRPARPHRPAAAVRELVVKRQVVRRERVVVRKVVVAPSHASVPDPHPLPAALSAPAAAPARRTLVGPTTPKRKQAPRPSAPADPPATTTTPAATPAPAPAPAATLPAVADEQP
jgi:hypothetical protein